MREIKTRQVAESRVSRNTPSIIMGRQMRAAFRQAGGRMSALAEEDPQTSSDEYAAGQAQSAAGHIGDAAVRGAGSAVRRGRDAAQAQRERKYAKTRDRAAVREERPFKPARAPERSPGRAFAEKSVKTARRIKRAEKRTQKRVVKTARRIAKASERSARRAAKAAERTSRAVVKTARHTAQATQKAARTTAKAARATAKAAAKAARAAAKAAQQAAKVTVKVVTVTAKAVAIAVRAIIAFLVAGGWVGVLIVAIISVIALAVCSCFGIFFSGEDAGTGLTVTAVVQEIDRDYAARLEEIQLDNPHDVMELSGGRAAWPEVLAVYAVRAVSDGQEVATMDEGKRQLLNEVFWAMHTIDYSTTTDDSGEETVITLYVTVSHRSADDMAVAYGFSEEQQELLHELLSDEYQELWNEVLYGGGDIVAVALSQVGNVGGEPYWSWYGFDHRVDWCAIFVSWCANECGYLDAGVLPRFAGCVQGVQWFQNQGRWQDRSYTPSPGDVIFFDWDFAGEGQDGIPDHAGIVEKVENGRVYTIEGNSGDRCCQRSYPVGYYEIFGYGIVIY